MKQIILLTLSIFTLSLFSNAQTSVELTVSATIVADSPVEIITISNCRIDITEMVENEIYVSPINNANAGLIKLIGLPNSTVRLTYLQEETITCSDQIGSIYIEYEMSMYPEQIQSASYYYDAEESTITFGESGEYFVWVGGRIDMTNATTGDYNGQFAIEIEYI